MKAEASMQVIMADNPLHTHGQRTVTNRLLCTLRVVYIIYSILIVGYFIVAFVTAADMSVTFLNFTLSIGGMALIIGEIYQFYRVESRRADRRKCAICTAIVFWYILIVIFAVPALYYFTFQQVYLAGLDVADSRDVNRECMLLDYYDTHSLWHILGSFMLLLTGLRVGMLSEPCRMCAMRMVGEASLTPSVAFEASQFHINKDKPASDDDDDEDEEERKKKMQKRKEEMEKRRQRRERIAQYEVEALKRRDTTGAKTITQLRDNKMPKELVQSIYKKGQKP